MGKTIVAIKPASSSTGASGVTRYIAESKRDPEKEHLKDHEPRPLFSSEKDELNFQQADTILGQGKGWLPEKDDIIHIVISPEKGQLELLGETHDEQLQAFKDIIRETAAAIEEEVGFYQLNWIAGIHLNTDIPHAHMVISRQGVDRSTYEPKHIDHLPRTLLPHNEITPEGAKEFKEGKIAATVNRGIQLTHETLRDRGQEIPQADRHSRTQPEERLAIGERNLTTISEPDLTLEKTAPNSEQSTSSRREPFFDSNQTASLEPPAEVSGQHHLSQPTELIAAAPAGVDHTTAATNFGPLHEEPETVFHPNTSNSENGPKQRQPDSFARIQRERETIGRSMVARGEVERLEAEFQAIVEHGDKRRFRVFDTTHGRTRQISEFDIHRRADARAARTVREQTITDPDQRHVARQMSYRTEIYDHDKAIRDHQIIVSKTTRKIGSDLNRAGAAHAGLQAQVRAIQTHYRAANRQPPVPLLSRDELAKLQDQAIASHNPRRVQALENIRRSLALEKGKPTRTDEEIARLEGQLLMTRAEQAARHERSYQFERSKHQTRWEIDGEKYSLAELDRRITQKQNRSRIFGTPLKIRTIHLLPSARRAAGAAAERLQEIRQLVLTKIAERKQDLASSLDQAVRMTQTLAQIQGREQENQRLRGGERLEKQLTRSELSHLIEHATTLSDRAMLQQAYILETQYHYGQSGDKKPALIAQAARAAGREVLSEIIVNQAREKANAFEEHKDFAPVVVKDLEGRELTARLIDFHEPRHPIKWLAHRLAETKEQRHLRREVSQAVQTEQSQLQEELSHAQRCHELTKSVAANHRQHVLAVAEQMPEPIFTTKQIMQLEIYAVRHQDLQERRRIESLINHAELTRHVFAPQAFDNEQRIASQQIDRHELTQDQLRDHESQTSLVIGNQQPTAPHTPSVQSIQGREPAAQLDQTGPVQDAAQDIDLIL